MFDHGSRYWGIDTAVLPAADGQPVAYVRRRFLPQGASLPVLAEVQVVPGERIDLLANRIYRDPLAFWRLCDGNDAMDPLEMLAEAAGTPGRLLRAPLPLT